MTGSVAARAVLRVGGPKGQAFVAELVSMTDKRRAIRYLRLSYFRKDVGYRAAGIPERQD